MHYVDGYLIPVPESGREAYRAMAALAAPVFIDHGALEVVENWGEDMVRGHTTDFFRAVKAEPGEGVVLSWIVWPDKAARDRGNAAALADPRFEALQQPGLFDGKRMVFSGFQSIVCVRT